MLDVVLDPKFASNKRIFFSYSESVRTPGSPVENSNIVLARAKLDEAAGALSDVTVIFRAKPSLPRTQSANQGGKIAIGPDGNVFMTDSINGFTGLVDTKQSIQVVKVGLNFHLWSSDQ